MGQLKKLASETAIYGLSSVVGRLLNYLLVPLYTTVFNPGEYGVVTELYAYVAFLNVIYVYGMETAYFRFATQDKPKAHDFYSTSFHMVLGVSLLLSGLLSLFAVEITHLLQYPGSEHYIYWFSAIMAADAIVAIPFAYLRLHGKAMKFATIKMANIGINIGLNLFFLMYLPSIAPDEIFGVSYSQEMGVGYVFLSNLAANLLLLAFLYREILQVKAHLVKDQVGMMLRYALPLMVIGLAGVTNEMLSRAMLKYLLPVGFYADKSNLEALGIFGACYKLSVFMSLGIQAFRYAAEPFFFNKAAEGQSTKLFSEVMDKFIIFGCWVFFVISINLNILGVLFLRNPVYREGLVIVPYLLMGGLFLGIYYNLSIWYKLTDKTMYGAVIAVLGAVVTIAFNTWLIPLYGYHGSAWVTCLTYMSMTIMSYALGQKYYPIPYKVGKGIMHLVVASVLVYAHHLLQLPGMWIPLIFNAGLAIAYAVALFVIEKKLS